MHYIYPEIYKGCFKIFREMIKRIYLEKIKRSLKSFPIIGIIGPKKKKKTTLAKQLMAELIDLKFTYIDCEHPRDLVKLSDPVLYFESNIFNYSIATLSCKPEKKAG